MPILGTNHAISHFISTTAPGSRSYHLSPSIGQEAKVHRSSNLPQITQLMRGEANSEADGGDAKQHLHPRSPRPTVSNTTATSYVTK